MKKSRGLLISILAVMLAASLAALAACGGGASSSSSSTAKESFDVSKENVAPVALKTDPFYVMLIGNDSRLGTVEIGNKAYKDGKGRSDTLMLVRIDPKTYQITLLTVPRDTAITYDGETRKINEMLKFEGVEGLEKAVTELTGITPDYYLMCTFGEFQKLIDDFGGIALDVKADQSMQDIVSGEQVEFPAGQYDSLNGKETLVFARERHAYDPDGEVYRQSNDRYVVQSLIEQILAKPQTALEVATKLLGDIETDWNQAELLGYVEDFIKNADKVTFVSGTGPWWGDVDAASDLWVTTRDEETWAEVTKVVNAGGDPNDVVETLSLYADDSKADSDASASAASADSDNGEGEGEGEAAE